MLKKFIQIELVYLDKTGKMHKLYLLWKLKNRTRENEREIPIGQHQIIHYTSVTNIWRSTNMHLMLQVTHLRKDLCDSPAFFYTDA